MVTQRSRWLLNSDMKILSVCYSTPQESTLLLWPVTMVILPCLLQSQKVIMELPDFWKTSRQGGFLPLRAAQPRQSRSHRLPSHFRISLISAFSKGNLTRSIPLPLGTPSLPSLPVGMAIKHKSPHLLPASRMPVALMAFRTHDRAC